MKKGTVIYQGPEFNKMRKAWRRLTKMRDIPPGKDVNKFSEAIFLLHEAIKVRCETHEEECFCHNDLYGRFLKFVSNEYDRANEKRTITDSHKFSCLPGWCNKFDRVHRFVLHCLACYEKGDEIETVSEAVPHYEDVYINSVLCHFLIEDQFGRYFYDPKTFNIFIADPLFEKHYILSKFAKLERPKAHGVGLEYIKRRLKLIDFPTKEQRRFLRKFKKRNGKGIILSGKNNRSKKGDSRKLPKVRWSGANNRQKGKDEIRETD